jgi:hypothetical protein
MKIRHEHSSYFGPAPLHFSEETQAAFRELFAAIEKQYGTIESVHFCTSFEDRPEFQRLATSEDEILDVEYPDVVDDEYCCNCGTALSRHDRFLCYDCQQDEWFNEDQDFYDGWFGDLDSTNGTYPPNEAIESPGEG